MDSSGSATRERILDVAEALLHRLGPAKVSVLNATLPFHHPHFLRSPAGSADDAAAKASIALLLAGLRAHPKP